jgi:GxxExxY protein
VTARITNRRDTEAWIVEDAVIVEVKSVERFAPIHRAQLLTYLRVKSLRVKSLKVGLLLNFNSVVMRNRGLWH